MNRSALVLGLLLSGALACSEPELSRLPAQAPNPTIEIDGCQETRGEVCVLRSEPALTIWVGPLDRTARVDFLVDGQLLGDQEAPAQSLQNGRHHRLRLPAAAHRLVVQVNDRAVATFSLEASSWPSALTTAIRRAREKPQLARELFADCPASLGERARPACWLMLAKTLATSPERDSALERARDGNRAAGQRLGEVDALTLQVGAAIERGDLATAERLLTSVPPPPLPARARYWVAYWRGLLERKFGRVEPALEQLAAAGEIAERLQRLDDLRAAEEARGLLLEEIGRFQSAAQIFDRLSREALPANACERARLWNNLGWTRYLAREQGEAVADPQSAFDRAVEEIAQAPCPESERFNLQVNRAVALLQAGRTSAVPAALAAARRHRTAANPEQEWWFGMAEAGLALARGDRAAALEHYDRLAHLDVPEARWRARFGRALALGDSPEALAELGEVEALLDHRLADIPAREGREWFIAQSEPVVRRRLALLLARGDTAAALDQVRRARARVLRGFAPPAADTEPGFAPPAVGELLLAFHPFDGGSWVALAATVEGPPRAVRMVAPPASPIADSALAEQLLGPFRGEIARARRLRILPYGRLREVDFHALPWGRQGGREQLIDLLPVAYALDLPRPRRLRGAGSALVIGDPRGDLPAAAQEATEVARVLTADGRQVELLIGLDADAERVRTRLAAGIELLHFAGHAAFAGPGGWQSELRLARDSRLTLADLLSLRHAPDWVVLSACDSGSTTADARVDGLGLAQTFLLGGSRGVVATTRPIADEVARPLIAELYAAWRQGGDLADALATAQRHRRGRGLGNEDWAAFRMLEP